MSEMSEYKGRKIWNVQFFIFNKKYDDQIIYLLNLLKKILHLFRDFLQKSCIIVKSI